MRSENVSRSCLTDPRIKYAKALKILTYAQELIRDPAHWTKFQSARDIKGNCVDVEAPNAVCFCAGGALIAANPSLSARSMEWAHATNALNAVALEMKQPSYISLNDETNHATVMQMFDRAKELLGEWP